MLMTEEFSGELSRWKLVNTISATEDMNSSNILLNVEFVVFFGKY